MRIFTKKTIVLSLLLSTVLTAAPLHLDDLIKDAILNSPDIKISKAQYEASEQRVSQADADYLPQVDLLGQAGQQETDYGSQAIGTPPNSVAPGKLDTTLVQGKITASQLIYDFGKTMGNIEGSEQTSLAFKAALQQKISDKIFNVKKAYYSLLYNNALIQVYTENVKLNEQQFTRAKRYFEAGIRTKVDVTDAEVNLIQAQLGLQNAGYATQLSSVDLKKEIGYDWDTGDYKKDLYVKTPDLVDVYESLPKLTLPATHYRTEAYNNRAVLEQFKQLVRRSESKHKQVDGDYYPGIYANGEYMAQDVDEDAFSPDNQWKAVVSMEWNLYAGNKTMAETEEARIDIMKSKARYENTKLEVQKEVRDAYIGIEQQLDSTKLTENLSRAAKEKYFQVEKRYEHGLADFVELQQARQDYINSLARLTKSYYAYYTSVAELDRAVGK